MTPPYARHLFTAARHATESPLILRPLNTLFKLENSTTVTLHTMNE